MDTSILRILRRHPLTRTLSADERNYLVSLGRVIGYLPGAYIFHESQPRRAFGILLKGRVELQTGQRGRPTVLSVLGAGDSFGEGSLLDDYPHSSSALVREPAEVLEIPREVIDRIAAERPDLHSRLVAGAVQLIVGQVRSASGRFAGRESVYLSGAIRREHDLLGDREVPDRNYYGIQTLRAVENFPITGIAIAQYPQLINALAAVKEAAAEANRALGLLEDDVADAIIAACREIRGGSLHNEFVVDVIQGGAGTSTNMNANEVIANRALELMGRGRGEYDVVHPNNHVNLSQSTNDAYPTALKIAAIWSLRDVEQAVAALRDAFLAKADEFADIVKMGRTQLQDAVPMTLGQEFHAFGVTLGEEIERLRTAAALIREINMGATAIGTGINTDPGYAEAVRAELSRVTGLDLITSPDLVEATQDTGAFVHLSGTLKRVAVKLSKICNDLRLLASGPRAGLAEIRLPAMQPGSSIMPGKVNPVIPEMVNQVCFQVVGNDLTVTMAAEAGQLQLNVFEPVIAFNIFQSVDMLVQACIVLRERCVVGIEADRERIRELLEHSIGVVTALVPYLGYERATAVAREALESHRGVYELVLEKEWMTRDELDDVLSPDAMTRPRGLHPERRRADRRRKGT
ncbi:MAG TPA: aspartate ammonia-lyase [Longimicrobiales bacterium]|nr:aspartate ammonia-lyase [Longimicrobiales bacterium]